MSSTIIFVAIKDRKIGLEVIRIFIVAIIVFITNSFWMIPFTNFYLNNGSNTVIDAKINQMASEDSYNLNRARGSFSNVSQLKGFWFDNLDYRQATDSYDYMMKEWNTHLNVPIITILGYLFFIVIILGVIYSFIIKFKYRYSLLVIFIFSLIMLFNSNPPNGFIFDFLRNHIPVFREAVRFPFTKISPLATVIYAIYFGFGSLTIFKFVNNFFKINILDLQIPFTIVSLIIFCLPMFSGNLIYKELKLKIPQEYFDMFKWFEDKPANPRIADLPQYTFWGWNTYDWGYRGSGFLWYGLKQPVLDRAFDTFSNENEEYYNELSTAIYGSNTNDSLDKVAKKYNIGWFLYDKHIKQSDKLQKFDQNSFFKRMKDDNNFKEVKNFNDKLVVFEYTPVVSNNKEVDKVPLQNNIGDAFSKSFTDKAYTTEGYYVNQDTAKEYLVRDINKFNISVKKDGVNGVWSYTKEIYQNGILNINNYFKNEKYLILSILTKRLDNNTMVLQLKYRLPEIYQDDKKVFPVNDFTKEIILPKGQYYVASSIDQIKVSSISGDYQRQGEIGVAKDDKIRIYSIDNASINDLSDNFATADYADCNETKIYNGTFVKTFQNESMVLKAQNAQLCTYTPLLNLPKVNYLLRYSYDYIAKNQSLPSTCLIDPLSKKCINKKENPSIIRDPISYVSFESNLSIEPTLHNALWLQFNLYSPDDKEQKVNIKNIKTWYYPEVTDFAINNNFDDSVINTPVNLSKGKITITFPIIDSSNISTNVNVRQSGYLEPKNCDPKAIKDAIYSKIITSNNTDVIYSSLNGDSCDNFLLPNLSQDANYISYFSAGNIQGYPMQICIGNSQLDRCDDQFLLERDKPSQDIYRILPAKNLSGNGYNINISNISRGNFPTINSLSQILIQFYPIDYITNIYISKDKNPDINDSLQIRDVSKVAPYAYNVRVFGKGILELKQGFNSQWLLVGESSDHFKTNNWSNGWIINAPREELIYLIYIPQILEYIGFLLVFMLESYLLYRVIKEYYK